MKRWQWVPLILVATALAALLWGMPQLNGESERASAQEVPSLEIDMDITNGAGPCDPVDATGPTRSTGATYEVAVCLTDSEVPPSGIQFNLTYDDTMNECVPAAACTGTTCLDSNPDVNDGTSVFTSPDLGSGWNCNISGQVDDTPQCDLDPVTGAGHGSAFLQCLTTGAVTLPVGSGVSSPLAVIEFAVLAGGTDTLSFADITEVADTDFSLIVGCPGDQCSDGTDIKSGEAPPTPTNTATPAPPTATPVRCGGQGQPVCTPTPRAWTPTPSPAPTDTPAAPVEPTLPPPPPPVQPTTPGGGQGPVVSPPSTGDGSGSNLWTNPIAALIAGIGAISLATGGLCFRVARRR